MNALDHTGLARWWACRYSSWRLTREDLEQTAMLGLCAGVRRHNTMARPDGEHPLGATLAASIHGTLSRAVLLSHRLGRFGTYRETELVHRDLRRLGGRPDETAACEEAARLVLGEGAHVEDGQRALAVALWSELSLDEPVGGGRARDDGEPRVERLPSTDPSTATDAGVVMAAFRRVIDRIAEGLSAFERAVLFERVIAPLPRALSDIADEHDRSRERARQLDERLRVRLRRAFEWAGLIEPGSFA